MRIPDGNCKNYFNVQCTEIHCNIIIQILHLWQSKKEWWKLEKSKLKGWTHYVNENLEKNMQNAHDKIHSANKSD